MGDTADNSPAFTVVFVPMLDTGIGREAGFRDDAHMIEAAKAERAAMPAWQREIVDAVDRKVEHDFLFGTG